MRKLFWLLQLLLSFSPSLISRLVWSKIEHTVCLCLFLEHRHVLVMLMVMLILVDAHRRTLIFNVPQGSQTFDVSWFRFLQAQVIRKRIWTLMTRASGRMVSTLLDDVTKSYWWMYPLDRFDYMILIHNTFCLCFTARRCTLTTSIFQVFSSLFLYHHLPPFFLEAMMCARSKTQSSPRVYASAYCSGRVVHWPDPITLRPDPIGSFIYSTHFRSHQRIFSLSQYSLVPIY